MELYDACQRQIDGCDRAIEAHVCELTATIAAPGPPPTARAARQRIEPAFDVRTVREIIREFLMRLDLRAATH